MPAFGSIPLEIQSILGMDERWRARPDSSTLLWNLNSPPHGGWRTMPQLQPGIPNISQQDAWVAPYGLIRSLGWFSIHSGRRQFLLWEDREKLCVFNGSTRAWTVLDSSREIPAGLGHRTQYCVHANRIYIVNGVDIPRVFDGWTYRRAGWDVVPNQPFVWATDFATAQQQCVTIAGIGLGETATGAGPWIADGAYAWAFSFVEPDGNESELSVAGIGTWEALPASGRALVGIVVPLGPPGTIGRMVYRTSNYSDLDLVSDARTFNFCYFIPDNCTTLWVDEIPDAGLGSEIDRGDRGRWPVTASLIASAYNRIWLAGMVDEPSVVRFSGALQPENFPAWNRLLVGSADTGSIKAIHSWRGQVVVFKERGVYVIRPDGDGWTVAQLAAGVGCGCPDSIRDVPGVGLVFASVSGLYALQNVGTSEQEGADVVDLSAGIPQTWRRITAATFSLSCAAVDRRRGMYILWIPVDGSLIPSLAVCLNFVGNGGLSVWWQTGGKIDGKVLSCVETDDHRGYVYVGSGDAGDLGLKALTDGGTPPLSYWDSAWLDFTSRYEAVEVTTVEVELLAYGQNTVALYYYRDRNITTVHASQVQQRESDDPSKAPSWSRWDRAVLDGAGETWDFLRPVTLRFSVQVDRCRQFRIRLGSEKRFWVTGARVHVTVGQETRILALDALVGG